MNSSEAAETLMKITLEGTELMLRMSGSAAAYLAPVIVAKLQDKKESPGKTKLINLLKSEKPLKIFTIKSEDVKEFRRQAKRYGINYAELKQQKSDTDNAVDIIVKAEDAARVNRIVERFNLAKYDETQIRAEINKDNQAKESDNIEAKESPIKDPDSLVADIFSAPTKEEESPLPVKEKIEKKNPLESSYTSKSNQSSLSSNEKKSVKKELQNIKNEQIIKEETIKPKPKDIKHHQPKTKKKRKGKQR